MKIFVNNCYDFDFSNDLSCDIFKIKATSFQVIYKNRSYLVDVSSYNQKTKSFEMYINNNLYSVQIQDRFDDLLLGFGIDNALNKKENVLMAPMPGRVVEVLIKEGTFVKEGDSLIILEAMKMENIIKSGRDGFVKKIEVIHDENVKKNSILLHYKD